MSMILKTNGEGGEKNLRSPDLWNIIVISFWLYKLHDLIAGNGCARLNPEFLDKQ